jgi:Protein of unknown function (DUF3515)
MKRVFAASVLCLVGLAGCGEAKVAVPVPSPNAKDAQICRSLSPNLPDTIADQAKRKVTDAPDLTAAWGNPPISLRCGVVKPPALEPTSPQITVNDVDWFAEELSAGWRFTSMNTSVFVEVTVPKDYSPQANALVDLSASLKPLVEVKTVD